MGHSMKHRTATSDEYRQLAATLRKTARTIQNRTQRALLLKTADEYEQMALSTDVAERICQERANNSSAHKRWAHFVSSELRVRPVREV
jgi:hypothetical protein